MTYDTVVTPRLRHLPRYFVYVIIKKGKNDEDFFFSFNDEEEEEEGEKEDGMEMWWNEGVVKQ